MKLTPPLRSFLLGCGSMLAASSAHAADVTWDTDPGTVGPGNGTITGGTGTWDTTNGNWTTDDGANNVAWDNGNNDTAIFGGTAGTVTLGADVTVGGLAFNTNGYSVAAGVGPYSITFGAPGDINVSTGTSTIFAAIAGSNTITKTGNGTLRLDGVSDSFTGDVAVTGGTLQIGNNNTTARLGGATYAGDIALDGGNLLITNNQTQTFSGVISGTGILNKGGSGILTLSGANTYTGQTRIQGSGAGGPGLSVSSFNSVNETETGAVMESSSLGAPTTVADGTILFGNSGNQRSSTLIYTGDGETTNRVMSVGFNNGSTHVIEQAGSGLLKFTSAFIINASSGYSTSGLTLTGSGDGEISAGFTPLGPDPDDVPGTLKKDGTGTWTLGGSISANSVNVAAGSLIINGSLSTAENTSNVPAAAGNISVGEDGTLGGSGTINASTIINGNLKPGNSPGVLAFTDNLTLGGTATTTMEINTSTRGTGYDGIDMGGILSYGGDMVLDFGATFGSGSYDFNLFDFGLTGSQTDSFSDISLTGAYTGTLIDNGFGVWGLNSGDETWTFTQSTGDLNLTVIPEPSSAALLGSLAGMLLLRRRR